jgi:hypothetical protein
MRLRLGGVLLFVLLASWTMSACATAGISTIYMSIDSAGAQRRNVFYTDSLQIFCVVKYSAARQDATLDFTIHQKYALDWGNPTHQDTVNIHQDFANAEVTPGPGVEAPTSVLLPSQGITVAVPCNGQVYPNLPVGTTCSSTTGFQAATCPVLTESLGIDSAGPGLTCCAYVNPAMTGGTSSMGTVPYQAGEYTCDVSLDGVFEGETEFTIEYPPNSCPVEPPFTGIPCYGWVPCGVQCPGYYPKMNGTSTPQNCTCAPNGTWSCE